MFVYLFVFPQIACTVFPEPVHKPVRVSVPIKDLPSVRLFREALKEAFETQVSWQRPYSMALQKHVSVS